MKIIIEQTGKIPAKKNSMRVYNNRMIKPKSVKEFEERLKMQAIINMNLIGGLTLEGDIRLTLEVTFGDKRRRDLQNCYGSVCDSLNDICYHDDSQIVELYGYKRYEKNVWKYKITVEEIK